jgi:alkaline phosphatase/alkaline phosphatase D
MKTLFIIAISILLTTFGSFSQSTIERQLLEVLSHPEHAQGEMAGLVTENSALLQTRLTLTNWKFDNDYPGCPGWARFSIYSGDPEKPIVTKWEKAKAENDYIVKIPVENLKPATRYFYRLQYGNDTMQYRTGRLCEFTTLAGSEVSKPLNFVVATCMNYDRMWNHPKRRSYGIEKELGYPAAEAVVRLEPDFFVGTGDNVYYDSKYMPMGEATDRESMRNYYHLQFGQPRMVELFANVPAYWEKDDHDYRYNDADTTGSREPSHELGIEIYREQLPVVVPGKEDDVTYKTFRVSKEVQFWLLENRDYRSPNSLPDGPGKTIWGKKQKEWIKSTILESDAVFKFFISPTPMIGPDDSYKTDNHVNHGGFRHERDEFFNWLSENNIPVSGFFFVNGDRHWQYHSIDVPSGYQEFSVGAFNDNNSRMGRNPGDPKSTDPKAKQVVQVYTSREPSGGFLHIKVEPVGSPWKSPRVTFEFMDERGKINYATSVDAPKIN